MVSILSAFLRVTLRSLRTGAVVGVALTVPLAAYAEDRPQAPDTSAAGGDPCSPAARQLVAKLETDGSVFSASGNGCLITGLKLSKSPLLAWEIADLRVEQADGAMSLNQGLRAVASGIVFSPNVFDARARYLARNQQSPYEVSLDYLVRPAARQFNLNELKIGNRSIGHLRVAFDATIPADSEILKTPVPLDGHATIDSIFDQWPTFQFTSVSLELENRGLFEKVILPLWINALPDGQDPEEAVPRDLARATDLVMQKSSTVIAPASQAAIARFLGDLPHPSGKLSLKLVFTEPQEIFEPKGIAVLADDFWQRIASVEAQYAPQVD